MESRIAVLPGPRTSFLDHLIPLCHLLEMPLHCSDDWVETCAAHFYPETEIVTGALSHYDTFYTAEPCKLHADYLQFGEKFLSGRYKTVAGFHGNPDKFRTAFWIERYADDDVVLLYGPQMIDYFKEKGVWERLKKTVQVGNLRYAFYQQHRAFFDRVVEPHLFANKREKTVLWAPTWSYAGHPDSSPFFALYEEVTRAIPEAYQLLIKPHPYLYRLYPEKIVQLKERAAEQVRFIDEIPLVYPLLSQCDIYLGDYSSVVYDFLAFNRPLFFLGGKQHPWGTRIEEHKRLFQELEQPDRLAFARKEAYEYAFGEKSTHYERNWHFARSALNLCGSSDSLV
ncbi:MAG: hypothetical protein S4CHLAM2_17540 [Chlamydiales bacterium]|nr:hypothetical protein [Chlamydiales bacterium]